MKPFKIDLDSIAHFQWTVIINGKKYRTTKQTAFYLSPIFESYSEKHPNLNSCKMEIDGANEYEDLINSILKLRGTFNITLSNFDFLRNFCEALHITLFDSQLAEFEEKVAAVAKSVSNEPHIRLLKSIERDLLRISYDRMNKTFETVCRASDVHKQEAKNDNSEVDFKPKKSSLRSSRPKKDVSNLMSNDDISTIPIVKSSLTVCSAIYSLCISQPQNIDMYVSLLSMFPTETIEKFKRIVLESNFESQEVSFLARMLMHHGMITVDELKTFNKCMTTPAMNHLEGGMIKCGNKAMKKGINFSMIDILSKLNESEVTNVKRGETIGEAFSTFFADLATQRQLKEVALKFDTFEPNYSKVSSNNWQLHKDLSFCGRNEQPIAVAIRKDDIDVVQKIISEQALKKNSTIKPSIYERFTMMNVKKNSNNDSDKEEEGIKLIDFSAFFGAIKTFKFLLLNGFEMSPMTFSYAICGGVSEIIHICEEKKCETKGALFYAIRFHRHDLFDWLIDTKGEDITKYDPFKIAREVVKFFNMTTLVNLIQRGFDPTFFVIPAIECRNLLLLEYLATIQHINFNLPIQMSKRKVLPIIDACAFGFNLDLVKFLIKYCKCDINQVGDFGITPLHLACLKNDEETVNFLLKQKKLNLMAKTIFFFKFLNEIFFVIFFFIRMN